MTESRFRFRTAEGARIDLLTRVAADGVAYRYVLPGDNGDVVREASAFTFPATAEAVISAYRRDNELPFVRYQSAAAVPEGTYSMQALFKTDGGYALIAESDLNGDYAGAQLKHAANSPTFGVGLWNDEPIQVSGALTTPWRAVVTGDLQTVTESTFTDDLAPKSRVRTPPGSSRARRCGPGSRAARRRGRAWRPRRSTSTTRRSAAGRTRSSTRAGTTSPASGTSSTPTGRRTAGCPNSCATAGNAASRSRSGSTTPCSPTPPSARSGSPRWRSGASRA